MKTLDESIVEKQHEFFHTTGKFTALLSVIKLGAKTIHRDINKVGLVGIPGISGAENVQGEVQQKLDLFANEKLEAALKACDIIAGIASEEEDGIVVFEGCECARYVALMDPLDGSSDIDVSVSIGTVSSIYHRATSVGTSVAEEDFLRPDNKQVAAGYVVCGSSTMPAYATGCDTHVFTYDPLLSVFCLCQERMRFPEKSRTYSISEGNYTKFPNGMKKYAKFCQEEGKSTNRPYASRYIDSLIADFHRNLLKGDIYPYPSAASHPDGKLHLLYERNPMTFLAERAGGKASDGKGRTLDIIPEALRRCRPFFVGNDHMTEGVERFIREFPDA